MYGANQSLLTLMLELRDFHNVTPVVLLRDQGPICNFLDQVNIKYTFSHFFNWVYENKVSEKPLLNFIKQVRNILRVIHIYRILRYEKINLFYTNGIPANIGIFLSLMCNCPHIWHIREKMSAYNFKFSTGKFVGLWLLRNGADRYILISDFLVKAYSRLLPEKKVFKIYNGVSYECDKKKLWPTITFNICLLGLVCSQKNQMDAVRAIHILVKEKKLTNIRLHIIGEAKKGYLDELKRYISHEELTGHVVFHGHQVDIHSLLDTMHLGLTCARDEAFGRATIEFMLHKLPVIACNSGANPELVKPGISGDLYELYNTIDLAGKIEKYFKDPELLQRIGELAYEYAKNNFTSEKNSEAIYQVIKNLLNV